VSDGTSRRLTPTRLERAVRDVYDAQLRLADEFTAAADRHADDAEVFHPCRMFGERSREDAGRLRAFAERCEPANERQHDARLEDSELRLLSDLRRLYLTTQGCLVDLTVVHQAALLRDDEELLHRLGPCLEGALTQVSWVEARIKTSAARLLTIE
jgi:hypothetical protein